MRAEKQILTKEYATRLNASPFFIVVGYQGLKVAHLTELRQRLTKAGSEVHVVKNTIFRIAAKESGVAELNGSLSGQTAVITGQKDVSAAAKAEAGAGEQCLTLSVPGPAAAGRDDAQRGDARRIAREIGALLANAEKYRCNECGFAGRNFYWHCPACHAWDSFEAYAIVKLG